MTKTYGKITITLDEWLDGEHIEELEDVIKAAVNSRRIESNIVSSTGNEMHTSGRGVAVGKLNIGFGGL